MKLSRFLWVVVGLLLVAPVAWLLITPPPNGNHYPCRSNLKQIAIGVLLYVDDESDHYPLAWDWMEALYPYTKSTKLFSCPLVKPGEFGYAYDSRLNAIAAASIKEPAKATVVFDSASLWRDAADPFTSLPTLPRHVGGNFVAYSDGHVKFLESGKP